MITRDLRDHARRDRVALEDPAVGVERDHALLDAGAGAVVEADHRDAERQRQVHDLLDLLGEDLAQGAAEDGEVLAEDADLAAVDGAEAGDHAVGVGPVLLDAHAVGPVAGQHVHLDEGALVEQVLDPLAAVILPLSCWRLTERSLPAWRACSRRDSRSASLSPSGVPWADEATRAAHTAQAGQRPCCGLPARRARRRSAPATTRGPVADGPRLVRRQPAGAEAPGLTPRRARPGCRRRPSGARRPPWCPASRAEGRHRSSARPPPRPRRRPPGSCPPGSRRGGCPRPWWRGTCATVESSRMGVSSWT